MPKRFDQHRRPRVPQRVVRERASCLPSLKGNCDREINFFPTVNLKSTSLGTPRRERADLGGPGWSRTNDQPIMSPERSRPTAPDDADPNTRLPATSPTSPPTSNHIDPIGSQDWQSKSWPKIAIAGPASRHPQHHRLRGLPSKRGPLTDGRGITVLNRVGGVCPGTSGRLRAKPT